MTTKPAADLHLVNVRGTELLSTDSREQYRQKIARITLDSLVQFVGLLDARGTVLEINRAALDSVGITLADVEGKPFWTTFWWQVSDEINAMLRDAIRRAAGGEFVRWDTEIYGRAGGKETILIDIALMPVKDERGEVAFIAAEARDITAKAHEPSLRELGARGETHAKRHQDAQLSALLSAIVDSSDDAIISKDLNGVIMSWNQGAERLFGYTPDEAIGQPILMLIPADRVHEETTILDKIRRGEKIDHFETIRRRKDGSLLNISVTVSPVKDADGQIVGASKVARDVTERVRQDRLLHEANAALERANGDLRQFAYSASHDLQEPLRTVAAYSELLKRRFGDKLGPVGDEYIEFTVQGATRMQTLLRDLRVYLQVSTSPEEPKEYLEAEQVLDKALANLELAIRESGATIERLALPKVRIHEFELEQLFQNLIGNAIRYRSSDVPQIRISATREGSSWRFSVQDNGIGIASEFKEQIFGVFKRLHSTAAYSGTGMGLAICHRIVERAGGRIWVESELGRGSTFLFTIPDRPS